MPLLYLPYTIILIFESNGQWKNHFSNHRGQLMGKVSLKTSLDHKFRRGASPLARSVLAFVHESTGKQPVQRTAWLPKQGFIYPFLSQKLQRDCSPARGCICSSRFP